MQNFLNFIEQTLEGSARETRGYRRQSRELFGDGRHEFVEERLGRLFHILTATPSALAEDLLEAVRLPDRGYDGVVVGDHLREEDLDLGHRTAQQGGVNLLLLAPAPDARNLGLQAGGDLPAESIERLTVLLPERGDGQPPLVHLLDKRDRATGGRVVRHGRDLQQKLGQAHAERNQGEEADHAVSLQVRGVDGRIGEGGARRRKVCRDPPSRSPSEGAPNRLSTGSPRGRTGMTGRSSPWAGGGRASTVVSVTDGRRESRPTRPTACPVLHRLRRGVSCLPPIVPSRPAVEP